MEDGISVLVLALNNSATLARTLDSVRGCAEVVVIDGGSSDGTQEIAASFPSVRLFGNPFEGFSEQRNYGWAKVSRRWCLILDSDEVATPELIQELHRIIKNPGAKSVYFVMRTDYFMGRAMESGYMRALYHPRFFQTDGVSCGGKIHESYFVRGVQVRRGDDRWGKLDPGIRILHDPAHGIRNELRKIGMYSEFKAQERIAAGETISAFVLLASSVKTFVKIYLLEAHKGRRGFIRAVLVTCHRTLANLLVYGQRVDDREGDG